MSNSMVVGRYREKKVLTKMLEKNTSELAVVFGRRRVGKTYLVRHFYQEHIVFELVGLYEGDTHLQLQNFHEKIIKTSARFKNTSQPKNWLSAFRMLEDYIDGLKGKKKKVIFIDEFPWIATPRSKFLMAFEHFWNSYCTKRNDLVVVVCGSAASFMVKKIIQNKGGLHNRVTQKIRLLPFDLSETEEFLKYKGINITRYDILQVYMAMGGVPYYLDQLEKGQSVAQNIDRLFFEESGNLVNEFNEVFKSLFSNSEMHESIMRALASVKKGVSRKQLLKILKQQSSGVFSKALEELTESGFVARSKSPGKKTKDALFRMADEYSLFYLKFVEKNNEQGEGTWLKMFPKQSYKIWSGLVFETVCLKHSEQIKKELGIDKIYTSEAAWKNDKAQIDLLIFRDDGIINLCEMKFHNTEYTINKAEYENLKNKILQFRKDYKTRKNIFITMISTYGITQNAYYFELVKNNLTIDCLFRK